MPIEIISILAVVALVAALFLALRARSKKQSGGTGIGGRGSFPPKQNKD